MSAVQVESGGATASPADEGLLHQEIADNARLATGARYVHFSWFDPATGRVQVGGMSSRETPFLQRGLSIIQPFFPNWDPSHVTFKADVNPAVRAVFIERKAVHVPLSEIVAGTVHPAIAQVAQSVIGMRWCFSCPVEVHGEVAGSLALHGPEPFTEAQIRTCEAFARQAALTLENARLLRTVREHLGELQQSRRLITQAEDRQRRDIAEVLHGRVQTNLLIVWHQLAAIEERWPDAPPDLLAVVDRARAEIDRVREHEVRHASHLLHPSIIRVGLEPAIRSLASAFAPRFEIAVETDPGFRAADDAEVSRIDEAVRLAAYRMVEESLANAVKHAAARRITIRLTAAERLRVEVADDGRGFDPTTRPQGLGVRTIASRVEAVGGEWHIESAPGRGTAVVCLLPLEPAGVPTA